MADYDVTVSVDAKDAESKLTDLETKIKNLEKTKPIKLSIDTTKGLSSQIKNIQNQIKGLSKIPVRIGGSGAKGLTSYEKAYQSMLNMQKQMSNIKLKMARLDPIKNTNQFNELDGQLKQIEQRYSSFSKVFGQKLTSKGLMSGINKEIDTTNKKLAEMQAKVKDTSTNKFAKKINSIKNNIDTGKYTNEIAKLELSVSKLGTKSQEVAKAVQNVKGAFANMNAAKQANDMTKLADAEKQYVNAMSTAKNMVSTQTSVEKMNNAMSQNVGLIDRFKSSFGSLATYFSGYMIISKAISGVKDMFNNVQQVDKAMTELYRITDLSDKHYEQLYSDMTDSAKEYKASLADVIEGTASWTRLGFKPDTAKGLSEITSMYQHVTDLDVGTATENLVTAYKGYQKQLLQVGKGSETKAVEHVADVYDAIGNQFAVSAADVGEGMTKTASALEVGGSTFEEAASMITAIAETTQDPGRAGNSLKTLSLRLRGMKGELEEMGEDVDDNVTNLSKMQGQVLNLTHGKVNIFDDNGDFKSTYDIMKGISEVYHDLTDTERANLLETIAGKYSCQYVQKCA